MAGKIQLRLIRHQVHVGKNCDAYERLLGNLRAPTSFRTGVIAFAFLETERKQEIREVNEMLARTAERMMIVVAPAEAELILAKFLNTCGAVAVFPSRHVLLQKRSGRSGHGPRA